ncbi:MAG: DNA mismatch repair protein MutS [Peptococcaceae bacterium]|nr:DNA mismatch repair protein MutS [Peptococcaceae bacterium]
MLGTTPMFVQYKEIKDQYQNMILFYRLGDFYEMFDEDAKKASELLGLTLTARDGGDNIKVPMCGVPFHSAEVYIKKLISLGEKVAICEQTEDPKAVKGLVKREVIRIVTPGMILEDNILDATSNYIICVVSKKGYGLSVADVSTGEFLVTQVADQEALLREIAKYHPSECVFSDEDTRLYQFLSERDDELYGMSLSPYNSYLFKEKNAVEKLMDHFHLNDLAVLNFNEPAKEGAEIVAAAVLLGYIQEMLRIEPKHMLRLNRYRTDSVMQLDLFTKKNLELVSTLNDHYGTSLFEILNKTETSAGGRLLRRWIEEPLIDPVQIAHRLEATDELFKNYLLRSSFENLLHDIQDIERIASRISCGSASPRDLVSLKNSLLLLPDIHQALKSCENPLFQTFAQNFDELTDVAAFIEASILDEPSYLARDGGVIRPSFNADLAELNELVVNGKGWLDHYLEEEKAATGIKTLKIGYNKVFGYYLDVTKSYQDLVPESYQRKQTLANSERYITDDLKEMENKLLTASERAKALEVELFKSVIEKLQQSIERLLSVSRILAAVDVFVAFAVVSVANQYCKPQLTADCVEIHGLRHPVIERQHQLGAFTPNDVFFDENEQRLIIITGPNMSGKSTYCRSVALAAIMAQIGCFVPASDAKMKVFDRVFARIGASDHLAGGRSTFMVEMNEVATITNNATANSLIILDEVGRGTSTYDGLALATAITKYINEKIHAYTLFATHYHELTALEAETGIKNYTVSVYEDVHDIVFLHKIIPGSASKSYGIHVAKKAGIPQAITQLASQVLNDLEKQESAGLSSEGYEFVEPVEATLPAWVEKVRTLDIENMTMREMAGALMDIVELAQKES